MKLRDRNMLFHIACGMCLAVIIGYACLAADETPTQASGTIVGLRLPMGYHPNGKIKSQLMAEKAIVPEKGAIQASNVTCEFYTVEGKLDIKMIADDSTYDKDAKVARSDSNVRVEKKDLLLTGTGYEWDSNEQVVKILNNVKVVIGKSMVKLNVKGKKK